MRDCLRRVAKALEHRRGVVQVQVAARQRRGTARSIALRHSGSQAEASRVSDPGTGLGECFPSQPLVRQHSALRPPCGQSGVLLLPGAATAKPRRRVARLPLRAAR